MIWHYDAKYYENGQVKWTPFDPNGSRQTVINYYPSGSKHVQHDLWRMQRVGPYIEYYENGIVKVNGCYTDGEFIGYDVRGNKKTGKWSFYDESGKLIKEEWYENNVLLKTQNYCPQILHHKSKLRRFPRRKFQLLKAKINPQF